MRYRGLLSNGHQAQPYVPWVDDEQSGRLRHVNSAGESTNSSVFVWTMMCRETEAQW